MLADNDELFRVTITPALTRNVSDTLHRVSEIVPLTNDDIAQIGLRARKQGKYAATTIASTLTFEQVAKLNLLAPSLPGIKTEFSWRRRYHDGAALSHVVGVVGSVNRFAIDDDAVMRLPDMRVGKNGAELAFDSELRGIGGTEKLEVDARGRIVRNLETIDPTPGRDIRITVDAELQRRVVERMQADICAAAVVLDVATGHVQVLASVPGYDARDIAGGISDEWGKLSGSEFKPLLNRAVAGCYAPGATFLSVTALGALEAGVVSPEEHIVCNGKFEYGGQQFRCSKPEGHGSVDVHDAIRSSCDVFFYEISSRLGISPIAAAARALGLGVASGIGLAEEKPGTVPDPDWKRGNLDSGWHGGETLLTATGRGYLVATPLQLAVMMARIASGCLVAPSLSISDEAKRGEADTNFVPLSFKFANCDLVRKALTAAVNDSLGVGGEAKLGDGKPLVAGTVSSETGARQSAEGTNEVQRRTTLFVGYEPADKPRYAIATVTERSADGNAAARLGRDVINFVLERDAADVKSRAGNDLPGVSRAAGREG